MAVFGGEVSPGFERVRDLFERHFAEGIEQCAQVCAYVRGRKVVDLWGARRDEKTGGAIFSYGPGSLQNVFSSSKVITSLVIAMLADRGLLAYDQLVAEIWPEYAQNGKESTTVSQVMRHEAGLSAFDGPVDVNNATAEHVRSGALSDFIARQKPAHPPGERRQYHGTTRGWIVNEIVRRVDPHGRTVGEFVRDEIAKPLGMEDELCVGLPDRLHDRVAPLDEFSAGWKVRQYLLPRFLGGGKAPGVTWVSARFPLLFSLLIPLPPPGLFIGGSEEQASRSHTMGLVELYNRPETRRCEIPSVNFHCSARAMAAVVSALVDGGRLPNGHQLLSQKGVEAAHSDPVIKRMFFINFTFCNAGWCFWEGLRSDFIGWMGYGGSVMQWHRQEHIGFAYAQNLLEPLIPGNARGQALQEATLACARRIASTTRSKL